MNLRERAWRAEVARMVARLDERIEEVQDDEERWSTIVLRDRLAGALGADEGLSTTPELRERARRDFAEAARLLGLTLTLEVPEIASRPAPLARRMAGFTPARPKHGDRA